MAVSESLPKTNFDMTYPIYFLHLNFMQFMCTFDGVIIPN